MSDLLTHAQQYAAYGWHVLQVQKAGKAPVLADWQNRATCDPAVIEEWWEEDYNLGVQMGPRSGLIDVECDNEEAERALVDLLGDDLVLVPTFLGKRGKHRLFRYTSDLPFPDRAVFKWRGVEFRTGNGGKGAQSVFPPSRHPDGPIYRWLVEVEFSSLGPFPASALAALRSDLQKQSAQVAPDVEGMIPEHHRHEVFLSLAGHLRGKVGLPEKTIYRMLSVLNEEHCEPPRPDQDVAKLARSMGNYPAGCGLNPPRVLLNGHAAAPGTNGEASGIGVDSMSNDRPSPVDWLVPGYLPLGKLALLAGDGGNGKSTITVHVAARLSRGLLPFQNALLPHGKPVEVLLVNCEDDRTDTVVPRLRAAGADMSKMYWVKGTYGTDGKLAPFNLTHYKEIEQYLKRSPNVKLVVIDPCSAYVGPIDDHRDAELRGMLGPLAELAMRSCVTFLLVKHLSKNVTLRAAHLVGGSVAWVNACRAAFAVAPDSENKDLRYFMPIKWNLGPPPASLSYNFQSLTPQEYGPLLSDCSHLTDERREQLGQQLFRISWNGPAEVEVDQVLSSSRQRQKKEKGEEKTSDAADWLLDTLQDGQVASEDIIKRGKEAGFGRDTLFRAKKELGGRVRARKDGLGPWYWSLEATAVPSDVSRDKNTSDSSGYSDGLDPFPEP